MKLHLPIRTSSHSMNINGISTRKMSREVVECFKRGILHVIGIQETQNSACCENELYEKNLWSD